MKSFWMVLVLSLASSAASAQTRDVSKSMFSASQCEIGQFARDAERAGLSPSLKANVALDWKTEINDSFGVNVDTIAKILHISTGPSVGFTWGRKYSRDDFEASPFNVFPGNVKSCHSQRPDIGVRDCLSSKIDWIKAGSGHCQTISVVSGKLAASLKAIIWFFNVGPSWEYDVTQTYTITVDAPVPKKQGQQ